MIAYLLKPGLNANIGAFLNDRHGPAERNVSGIGDECVRVPVAHRLLHHRHCARRHKALAPLGHPVSFCDQANGAQHAWSCDLSETFICP